MLQPNGQVQLKDLMRVRAQRARSIAPLAAATHVGLQPPRSVSERIKPACLTGLMRSCPRAVESRNRVTQIPRQAEVEPELGIVLYWLPEPPRRYPACCRRCGRVTMRY
jgi:hypothetical protein